MTIAEKFAKFGTSIVKAHPDYPPQISDAEGKTWEDIDFSDVKFPVVIESPGMIFVSLLSKRKELENE